MNEKPKDGERIAKRLARAGVASRRDAEKMVAEGRVSVNGKIITSPALNVKDSDKITVDGTLIAAAEASRLWLYHKPHGLVTSAKDEKGRETVFDKLPPEMPRVMSIGRLDLTSEGLLLLTNDGEIKRKLELPSTGWQRRYRVRVNGTPDEAKLQTLRAGIVVEGEKFQPMIVTLDRQQGANAWLTVGIREGKNREIRRAMEHIGLVVNRLIRTSYGPFKLGTLAPGEVEEVKARILRDQLGLEPPAEAEPSTGRATAKPERKGTTAPRSRKPRERDDLEEAPPARTGGKPTRTRVPRQRSGKLAETKDAAPKTSRPQTSGPQTSRPTTTRPTTKAPRNGRPPPKPRGRTK
ncbi:MAG: pseudouridine synthase [Deltaproteobacteria bacterium]